MGTKIPDLHNSDMQQVEERHFAKTFGDCFHHLLRTFR